MREDRRSAPDPTGPFRVLLGAVLLNAGLGTLYAWSVFLAPFEAALGVTRGEASAVFSTATVCFVLSMLGAPALQARLTASQLALLSGMLGAVGLVLAAHAGSLAGVLLGYGVLFGTANGLGYSLALQATGRAFVARRGLAMGAVVAAYALGAAGAAPLLTWGIEGLGLRPTLLGLAAGLLAPGLLCAVLLRGYGRVAAPGRASRAGWPLHPGEGLRFAQLWLGFLLGASAGLLAIGHAAGIIETAGGTRTLVAAAPVVISIGNGAGRLAAGWLADRFPVRGVLTLATTLGTAALLAAGVHPTAGTLLAALASIGGVYGILAAAYPIAVAEYFGAVRVSRVFGAVFTAWGVGGILGPWVGARAYIHTGSYEAALLAAAAAAGLATLCTAFLPRQGPRRPTSAPLR